MSRINASYLTSETHCPRCIAAGHPACYGSPRACAFPPSAGGKFCTRNWSCATMDELRRIAYQSGWALRWNDQSIAVMPLSEVGFIVLGYYKERGCTDAAYTADDREPITLAIAEDAIAAGVAFVKWSRELGRAS